MSYHCGSIWSHDTAIAVVGLHAEGQAPLANHLARGLVNAAEHFGGRRRELYAALDDQPGPLAYLASCAPQAWAAAGVIAAALHLAGVHSPVTGLGS